MSRRKPAIGTRRAGGTGQEIAKLAAANKMQVAVAHVTTDAATAKPHRIQPEPGSGTA